MSGSDDSISLFDRYSSWLHGYYDNKRGKSPHENKNISFHLSGDDNMKKRFRFTMVFEAEVNGRVNGGKMANKGKINQLLKEFVKDEAAVLDLYKLWLLGDLISFRHYEAMVLFGVRGRLRTLKLGRSQENILLSRKSRHSIKPEALYHLIEQCSRDSSALTWNSLPGGPAPTGTNGATNSL